MNYSELFAGLIKNHEGERIAQILVQLPIEEWLGFLQNTAYGIVLQDWKKMDEARQANALVFSKPVRPATKSRDVRFVIEPELELMREVLSIERYIPPIEWKEGMEAEVDCLRIPQSYLGHPLRVDWGKRGLSHLRNGETSTVDKAKRVKFRVVEDWTKPKLRLPWVNVEDRKRAADLELLEQKVKEEWCTELVPMEAHFIGREHLIIRTEGGMGSTSHSDGIGGWGYLSKGWKVVITVDSLEIPSLGWTSKDQLLDLAKVALSSTVKWTLLGPGMSIWFTPDSHHAIITLCSSAYVTWSATMSPHRVLYTLGLVLNGYVEDYTWVATTTGGRASSSVYVNVMQMLTSSFEQYARKIITARRTPLIDSAYREYKSLEVTFNQLFGDEEKVYQPINGAPLTLEESRRVRELFRVYTVQWEEEDEGRGGKGEAPQ